MSAKKMCAGCAFRPGTDANKAEHTQLLATLCVEARDTFTCHEDGHVCRGWAAAVAASEPGPEWKQAVAQIMADEWAEAVNEGAMGHRIDGQAAIDRINRRIAALFAEAKKAEA